MNDFDRLLEFQLRRLLDPVVASPVPVRRTQEEPRRRYVMQSVIELTPAPDTTVAVPVEVFS
ncbi:MAG: hypothetical protein M3003_13145 [Candidatus Dormibacteraeota bacterium]|nr:hypothetical protein [Candidatus Dormibacteraeota bacterium]